MADEHTNTPLTPITPDAVRRAGAPICAVRSLMPLVVAALLMTGVSCGSRSKKAPPSQTLEGAPGPDNNNTKLTP